MRLVAVWVKAMMLQSFNILPLATVMLQSNSIKLMLNSPRLLFQLSTTVLSRVHEFVRFQVKLSTEGCIY